VRKI
jgi:hypothetical protein